MATRPSTLNLRRQSDGQPIVISTGRPIGAGGEARIYPVEGRQAAKIYHTPDPERARKLAVMLANPPEDAGPAAGQVRIAWPTELLEDMSRRTVGYLMPRVSGMRPVFHFYNPLTRRQESPLSNYLYLQRTARNLAAAFRTLHARGYVIGDVNESNILVTETALVTLVDTDSFQVRDPGTGRVYRCPVGKPEYTPPELQGKTFALSDRTPEQDCFGLAVLIFQLLMEGTHPFAGVYLGAGDPPTYEERILAGHFPYGTRNAPYRRMPVAPPFEILNPTLRQLFLRCFEDGHTNPAVRPDALIWQNALSEAETELVICDANPQHRYGRHLQTCPWCKRRDLLKGRDPFPTPDDAPRFRRERVVSRAPAPPGTRANAPRPLGNVPGTLPPRPPGGRSPNRQPAAGSPATVPVSNATGQAANAPPPGAFYNFVNYGGYSNYQAWAGAHQASPGVFSYLPRVAPIWIAAGLALLSLLPVHTFWAGPLAVVCGLIGWYLAVRSRTPGRWMALLAILLGAMTPLVSASLTYTSVHSTAPLRTLSASAGPVRAVAFSSFGRLLAGASDRPENETLAGGGVNLWDPQTGELLRTLGGYTGDVTALAFSPDGRMLAAAAGTPLGQGDVRLWDLAAGQVLTTLPGQAVYTQTVAFSPDGSLIACGGRDRKVRLWHLPEARLLRTIPIPGEVFSCVFSPDGRTLAVGSGSAGAYLLPGRLTLLTPGEGKALWTQTAHSSAVYSVAFSPDGQTVASGGSDNTIRIWNARTGQWRRSLEESNIQAVASLTFSPDGRLFASAESNGQVRLWDAETWTRKATFADHSLPATSVAFSKDNRLLASGGQDKTVVLHRLR